MAGDTNATIMECKHIWVQENHRIWKSSTGGQVVLNSTKLQHLSQVESKMMQQFSCKELLRRGFKSPLNIPKEIVGNAKKKKQNSSRTDVDSEGLVFGISLQKCIQNDKRLRPSTIAQPNTLSEKHRKRFTYPDSSSSEESPSEEVEFTRNFPVVLKEVCQRRREEEENIALQWDSRPRVPNIVQECVRYLEEYGLEVTGLFTHSSSTEKMQEMKNLFDCGLTKLNINNNRIHDVANLLKEYFRALPQYLLPGELYQAFLETQRLPKKKNQILSLRYLIQMLPPSNQDTLRALLMFLNRLASHSTYVTNCLGEEKPGNQMNSYNLAIVFAPNILHGEHRNEDVCENELSDIIGVIRSLIDNVDDLFYVSADSLDRLYIWMMNSNQKELDELLNKKEATAAREKLEVELINMEKKDVTGKEIIAYIPFLTKQPDGGVLPYSFRLVPEYKMNICLSDEIRKSI